MSLRQTFPKFKDKSKEREETCGQTSGPKIRCVLQKDINIFNKYRWSDKMALDPFKNILGVSSVNENK